MQSDELRAAIADLPPTQRRFAEFFLSDPGVADSAAWSPLAVRDDFVRFDLQRWLLFLGRAERDELARATSAVCRLVRSIPQSIFGLDPAAIADWYDFPADIARLVTAQVAKTGGLDDLLARADLIWTADGLKTCEINASGNLGGWEVGSWVRRYRQVEPLARFLDALGPGLGVTDPLDRTFDHLVRVGVARGFARDGRLDLAIVRGVPSTAVWMEFLDRGFRDALDRIAPGLSGGAVVVHPDELALASGRLVATGRPIDLVIDGTPSHLNRVLYGALMDGSVFAWNGPVASLVSHKSNLALLSDLAARGELPAEDAADVALYIPWTRRVGEDFVDYEGERHYLPDLLAERPERFVLKAGLSGGGEAVYMGRTSPPAAWEDLVSRALAESGWIVQEFADSRPYLLGDRAGNPQWQDIVWGAFAWGQGPPQETYQGAFLRHKPCAQEGIINAAQGATIGVYFDVDDA